MTTTFKDLGLNPKLLPTLEKLGYEIPTPIQSESIPVLVKGGDVMAQAQTGTGKTAAFALPLLSRIDIALKEPQILVIVPTRELAIQVSEAFQTYSHDMKGFFITPIYGGQDYSIQLRALKRGVHVIVGTPGRLMDHLRRGTLKIDQLQAVVLDEADEMLKMGFIDDIDWILSQMTHPHQTALFSATIPQQIKKIANRYLKDAEHISIKSKSSTVDTIEQSYIRINNNQKIDLLTRVLEVEDIKAVIIFTRTKTNSAEVAEKLQARGYAASPLNGDMAQAMRKKVIDRIKKGSLDIIVATDVAARGIDVERVSHVINYDIPTDTESYVHRIGRTGRAGRKGTALLFVTPRENRLLKDIERAISKPIKEIEPPSLAEMTQKRSEQLAEKIVAVIDKSKKLKPYYKMMDTITEEHGHEGKDIAAALAYLLQQANPLPSIELESSQFSGGDRSRDRSRHRSRDRKAKPSGGSRDRKPKSSGDSRDKKPYAKRSDDKKPYAKRSDDKKPYAKRSDDKKPYAKHSDDKESYAKRSDDKKPYAKHSDDKESYAKRSDDKKPYAKRSDDKKPYAKRSDDKKPYAKRSDDKKPYAKRSDDKKPYAKRSDDKKSYAKGSDDKKSYAKRSDGNKSRTKKPADGTDWKAKKDGK